MKKYYPFLDGFRAIAIIMILAHHVRRGLDLDHWLASDPPVLSWIFFRAHELGLDLSQAYWAMQFFVLKLKGILGVEMFLVISGFLITGILLGRENKTPDIKRFYQRRFFRIYPSYFLVVIISLTLFAWHQQKSFGEMSVVGLRYLTFMQNYFPRNVYLEHAWTLAVLEQFYIFVPLVVLGVYAKVRSQEDRRLVLIGLCLLTMVIVATMRWYYLENEMALIRWPLQSPYPFKTVLYHADALAFGCLLSLLEFKWSAWKKSKRWGLALWGVGMGGYYYLFLVRDWSYYWGEWWLYIAGYLSTGCLIIAAYHGISIFARLNLLQRMGRHAYSIYLWNYLVLLACQAGMGKIPTTVLVITYFVLSISLGILCSKTLERYFLSVRERFFPKGQPS